MREVWQFVVGGGSHVGEAHLKKEKADSKKEVGWMWISLTIYFAFVSISFLSFGALQLIPTILKLLSLLLNIRFL